MPNWCNNVVELKHTDPTMIDRARKAFAEGALLQEFFPCPADLEIVAGFLGDTDEQKELEAKEQANLEKYGYKNWYDWKIANWGTKWDVGGGDGSVSDIEGGVSLAFDSAWSPPIGAFQVLTDLGFSVKAFYFECGMAFAGVWEDGDDQYFEYGGMDSQQISQELPVELDEMFAISEQVAEYEAEQEEEQ